MTSRRGRADPRGGRRSPTRSCRRSCYPPELPVASAATTSPPAIRDHQVVDRRRRDRLGQDHPARRRSASSSAAASRGMIGHTQPRRIAARTRRRAHRRGARRPSSATSSATRCASPTSASRRHAGQADDRRHPAGRDPARPAAAQLRHDHHRRGPRAQPQHRLPARLPRAAAAAPARPQGHHHLGHHRPGAVRRALRTARPIIEVSGPHLPGRGPLPPARRPTTRTTTATSTARPDAGDRRRGRRAAAARGPATSWCSSPASARSATPPTRCRELRPAAAPRSLPLYARLVGRRAAPGLPARTPAAGSCSPPTSPRPR